MNDSRRTKDIRDIGCLESIEAMYAWLDGELRGPNEIAQFEHHLEHCRSCYSRAEMEQALTARLREKSGREKPSGTLKRRLNKLMDDFD